MLTAKQYLGLDDSHLVEHQGRLFEANTLKAFVLMQKAAKEDGINIDIASSYRSFATQMKIWNNKATGKRPLLNNNEQPLEFNQLTQEKIVDAILLWSALPGTSRHHWGTDLDLYDGSRIKHKDLQLVSGEYENHGPCAKLSVWLTTNAAKFGFYRPFVAGKSGVGPEPWHYSYHPISEKILASFDVSKLQNIINNHHLECKQVVLQQLDRICQQYVFTVARPEE